MRTSRTTLAAVAAFVLLGLAPAASRAADLNVCADPSYLPFSNRAGAGFENQIAAYVAKGLGDRLVYHWANTRPSGGFEEFVHTNLDAKKCDVLIDVPYASENVLPTHPYYVSSYVFVFPKSKHYDITSMDSSSLKNLKIGFEADTPAENGLKLRALVLHSVSFDSGDAPSGSPAEMLDALSDGRINVGVTWEPAVGMFLRERPQLAVVAVPNSRSQGSPEQYAFPMAMAVRAGNTAERDRLSHFIDTHAPQLTAILEKNGVKLYKPTDVATK